MIDYIENFSDMSNRLVLTEKQLEKEAARIMNGEDSDPESFEDSGSDWEEDNLEVATSDSDNTDLDENDYSVAYPIQQKDDSPLQVQGVIDPSSGEDDIPLSQTRTCSIYLVTFKTKSLKGKNGHKWSTKLPQKSKRTGARNIVHFISGPKGPSKDCSLLEDYFLHFFSNNILDTILQHTNEELEIQAQKYSGNQNVSKLTKDELKAMFSILMHPCCRK